MVKLFYIYLDSEMGARNVPKGKISVKLFTYSLAGILNIFVAGDITAEYEQ